MKKILYSLCAVAALLFTSCDDPAEGTTFVADGQSPIANRLLEMGDFKEYVSILQKSNMYNALNYKGNSKGFTALAPNDQAMAEFYTRSGMTAETMTEAFARDFVLYHTLEDSLSFEKIMPEVGKDTRSITNLSKDKITVSVCQSEDEGMLRLTNSNSYGIVTATDSAKNGSIFILSRALTPLVENLYDRVKQDEEYGIMKQAIDETGWDVALTTLTDEAGVSLKYTVLAVTDATFAKAGISSLDALKQKLVETSIEEGITPDSLLRAYVGYHIVKSSNTLSALGAVQGANTTRLWDTGAKNLVFTITTDEEATAVAERYAINAASTEPTHFVADKSNVLALNGYLHQIDSWMPIWEPEQQTVIWDLADDAKIKEIAGDDYQPEEVPSSAKKYDVTTAYPSDAIVAKENSNNSFADGISYFVPTTKVTDANIAKGVKPLYNNDCLVFNLGNTGSATLTTPTLVRGKYKVVVDVVYNSDLAFIKNKTQGSGGTLEMSFDGKDKKYDAPYTKIPTIKPIQAAGAYPIEIYDVVEFESTSTHTFTITVKDGAAATNTKYSLQFDTITFIPVE